MTHDKAGLDEYLTADPDNIQTETAKLRPGNTLLLEAGTYSSPVFLSGLGGTAQHPIVIRSNGDAVFTGAEDFDTARKRINDLVYRRQRAGYYPSIGQTADEAWLTLRNCRYVRIENIRFEACWPGAIYIDDSQHITISNVHFLEGTIAIGANGASTRDLLIEKCSWQQDTSDEHKMWKDDLWWNIHGHSDEPEKQEKQSVNIADDYRLWDGDFFRAWDIPGNVTIRENTIQDAFNGIHFFNRRGQSKHYDQDSGKQIAGEPNGSANVLIENNIFIRVRDNVVEPEEAAWNWVVRYNAFLDCYRWFSLEMQYGGYIYIYGNVGWDYDLPGGNSKGSVYKFSNGSTAGVGPFYSFHNSWLLEARVASKNAIKNFHMYNNAVDFVSRASDGSYGRHDLINTERWLLDNHKKRFQPNHLELEKKRFTTRWQELNIVCDGDILHHPDFPRIYNDVNMKFGPNCLNKSPGFCKDKCTGDPFAAFQTSLKNESVAFVLALPYGDAIEVGANVACRGAVQADGRKYELPREFGWISTKRNPTPSHAGCGCEGTGSKTS